MSEVEGVEEEQEPLLAGRIIVSKADIQEVVLLITHKEEPGSFAATMIQHHVLL